MALKVVAMCDSNGYIYDPEGIKLDVVKEIKEVRRGRIKEYADRCSRLLLIQKERASGTSSAISHLPCATQNELESG